MITSAMSKLLINEPPLQVLPTLAIAIGLNEAIFLQQIHYWLTPTVKYKPHYREYEGVIRPWVYNTYHTKNDEKETGWQANFPFWSVRTIKRIVSSLKEKDLIIVTDQFNTASSNRTLWYTIDYDNLATYEEVSTSGTLESANLALSESAKLAPSRECQVGTLMTETTAETTAEINISSKNSLYSPEKKADLNTLVHYVSDIKPAEIATKEVLRSVVLVAYDVTQACKIDVALASAQNLKAASRVALALYSNPNIAQVLKDFLTWWAANDWRGQKGQPPTPAQIGDTWGQFEASQEKPASNGPVLTDQQKARLAELIAENK